MRRRRRRPVVTPFILAASLGLIALATYGFINRQVTVLHFPIVVPVERAGVWI